jgi:hypothetical protein
MSLRRCESPGVIAQIAALSVDHAPTAIIGCPYHWRPLIKGYFGVALVVGAVMSSAFRAENWIRWP